MERKKTFFSSAPFPSEKMFHINKQLLSPPSSPAFFPLSPPPLSFVPRWKEIVGACTWIAQSVSQSQCTNLSDSNPGWCMCGCRGVRICCACVCLHEFGLGTCALTATCWVSLVLRVSWPDDTVTHVSRMHPVQSAVICKYLVTHSGSQTHSWVFMHFSFDELEEHDWNDDLC